MSVKVTSCSVVPKRSTPSDETAPALRLLGIHGCRQRTSCLRFFSKGYAVCLGKLYGAFHIPGHLRGCEQGVGGGEMPRGGLPIPLGMRQGGQVQVHTSRPGAPLGCSIDLEGFLEVVYCLGKRAAGQGKAAQRRVGRTESIPVLNLAGNGEPLACQLARLVKLACGEIGFAQASP
jgi:hypothetical protein